MSSPHCQQRRRAAQVEAEADELLLLDEDMLDVDPEQLPRRLLSDFSIYNAEARPRTCACIGLPSRPAIFAEAQPALSPLRTAKDKLGSKAWCQTVALKGAPECAAV